MKNVYGDLSTIYAQSIYIQPLEPDSHLMAQYLEVEGIAQGGRSVLCFGKFTALRS